MSDKDRKKKDGQNKDKKNKAMRESVKERAREPQPTRSSAAQPQVSARHWLTGLVDKADEIKYFFQDFVSRRHLLRFIVLLANAWSSHYVRALPMDIVGRN
jgi:hypothetical protein